MSAKLHQKLAVVSCIDPDAYGTGAVTGDWVDMRIFRRVMFIFQAGDLGTSATVDGAVQEATDSSGTNAQAMSPAKAITQLTKVGTDDNKQAVIEVHAYELSAGFTHVAPVLTVGVAASDAGVIGLAGVPRYHPASDNDLASVDEIVG